MRHENRQSQAKRKLFDDDTHAVLTNGPAYEGMWWIIYIIP
jgi:hypothetical protein